jgi:hypothetical protein
MIVDISAPVSAISATVYTGPDGDMVVEGIRLKQTLFFCNFRPKAGIRLDKPARYRVYVNHLIESLD